MGALVEIQDVTIDVARDGPLADAHIELPRPGWVLDAGAVDLKGWALGGGVEAVEVRADGALMATMPLDVERADIVEGFPNHPEAEALRSGFRTTIDLVGAPPEFNLEVWASFRVGESVMIAALKGRHRWRRQSAPAFTELASVVISCCDEAKLLAETIESALVQTYPHLEVVLVDGSRDGRPREIADAYEGVRVFARDSPEDDPYNEGIRHTNGDFLAFVSAGDRLMPRALATGVALFEEHAEWAFARGRCRAISPGGSPLPAAFETGDESDPYDALLRGARVEPSAATVYRRAVFEDVEAFDPSLGRASNLDLDLRIASRYAAGLHDEVVAEHRLCVEDARTMMHHGLAALARQRRVARRTGRGDGYRDGRNAWRRSWKAVIAQQTGRPTK